MLDAKGLEAASEGKHWSQNAWRAPHFEHARVELRRALRSGKVVRPATCEHCGITPAPMKDGRSAIQGHHHDYAKPLDVQWLCYSCHRAVTPVSRISHKGIRGSQNSQAKLTEAKVLEIRARYSRNFVTQPSLAAEYGVSVKTIERILKRERWAHV